MNGAAPDGPPRGVPTLTEVVDWAGTAAPASTAPDSAGNEPAASDPAQVPAQAPLATLPSESELTALVLERVQHELELMIEYRIREALTPLLARAADSVVRDARHELASTLRDVIARAVEQELARQRGRQRSA